MKIHCAYDKLVPIRELKPHHLNRNKHPKEQIERLAKILTYQGFRYPVKVSKLSGFITSGHGRVEAAKLNGWTEVPVNFQDYDSDEMEIADLTADNAIASWAELDLAGLNSDIGGLGPDFDIELLGLKDFTIDIADKLEPQCDEDEVPEPKESIAKLGDVWKLGRHRLMCGDSTSIDAVENLMNGEKADMVFTDPPYGMRLDTAFKSMGNGKRDFDLTATSKSYREVIGDHDDYDPSWLVGYFNESREVFLWGCDYYAERIPERNKGSWVVWDKTGGHDSLDKIFASNFELCWSRERHKREVCRITWKGAAGMKPHDGGSRTHPTQKPVDLGIWFFNHWGKSDDIVVDLFGGSGSTLIACEKTNRKCFMMELDPHYCDVIVARWEKYTGQKAELISG